MTLPEHIVAGLKEPSPHDTNTPIALSTGAVLALVVVNVLWGASSAAGKIALQSFGPCTLAVLRFVPAGLLLFGIAARDCYRRGEPVDLKIRAKDRPALALLGVVGIGVTYGLFLTGLKKMNSTDASLLFACEPILIAIFALIFLRERLNSRQWMGLLLGIAGVYLLVGNAFGNEIALVGLAMESSVSVVAKRLTERYDGLVIIAWEMIIGSAALLPFAAAEVYGVTPHIAATSVVSVMYLGLICSAMCYGVWYYLLNQYQVSMLGAFILIQSLSGPLWGWALRHDALRKGSAVGAALVLSGVALTTIIAPVQAKAAARREARRVSS